MEVAGVPGCDTKGGDAKCPVPVGGTFTVNFLLNDRAGIDYRALQVHALYSGVTSKDNEDANVWPDCVYAAIPSPRIPGEILIACLIGIGAPLSMYTGVVATVDFNCTADETSGNTLTLVHGPVEDTLLGDENGDEHYEGGTETLTINCVPCQDSDGDTICDDVDPDDDNDGCTDMRELGSEPNQGGQRDPLYFWDFFDTPDPNGTPQRDKLIRISDVVRVIGRFGTDDEDKTAPINRNTDPLSTPAKTGYHPAYDRGGVVGPNPWNLAPADGTIRIGDIVALLNQFGHSCA